jgi:hypothetical protein
MQRRALVAGLVTLLMVFAAGSRSSSLEAGSLTRSSPHDELLLYHAKFKVRYEVAWHTTSGSPDQECSRWYDDRGTSTVVMEDAAWTQTVMKGKKKTRVTRTDGIPGSITVSTRWLTNGKGVWATGSAVGRAKGRSHRTWIQRGGVNWTEGCGTKPEPFRPEPDDCGTRTFKTRTATFMPQSRRRFDTLTDVMSTTPGSRPAFAFSMPGRALYKACEGSFGAPDLPANFGFWLSKVDIRALAKSWPGDTTQFHSESSGDCTYDTDPADVCTFELELTLDVRRWEPGTPYP